MALNAVECGCVILPLPTWWGHTEGHLQALTWGKWGRCVLWGRMVFQDYGKRGVNSLYCKKQGGYR